MDVALGVSLDGASLSAGLDALSERLGDMSGTMAGAASVMRASVDLNFAAGGRPEAWAPLAEATVGRKGFAAPLQDTGRLRYDMRVSHGPLEAKVTAGAPYALTHQNGGPDVPARPFMLIQPADRALIGEMVAAHIVAA